MIISIDTEKSFDKIYYSFMRKEKKYSRKTIIRWELPHMIKNVYENPQLRSYSLVKIENFPPKIGYKIRMSSFTTAV